MTAITSSVLDKMPYTFAASFRKEISRLFTSSPVAFSSVSTESEYSILPTRSGAVSGNILINVRHKKTVCLI